MQVQVNTDDKIHGGESLAQWAQSELQDRLARFRDHLTRVEVFFTDENSTKGGNDKRCRLEARVAGRSPVAVTAEAEKVAEALTKAADKLIHALDSDLGRAKDKHGHDTIRTQGAGE